MVERSPRQLRLFGNRLRPNRAQRERGKRWIELARRQLDKAEGLTTTPPRNNVDMASTSDQSRTDDPIVSIETTDDGPFLVNGHVTVRSATPVTSERGEPMTWRPGPASVVDSPALCRCGHSGDKPYCDGSHTDADWEPSDGELPDGVMLERAERIERPGLTLLDDQQLCMHAGFCGSATTDVWAMLDRSDDTEIRATVIRMVEKCPSGRLVNEIDGEPVEPSLPTEIGVVPGGPLWVTGGVEITSASGQDLEVRNRVTLCRCGASSMKPLCDGSHTEVDFDG